MTIVSSNFATTFLYFQKVVVVNTRLIRCLISHINNKITGGKIKQFLVTLNHQKSMQIYQLHTNYKKLYQEH